MSNKNLQNSTEVEILSVSDVKIQQMIKNLQRVDAPKDFDFRLKARIANAQPSNFQPRFLPVLRYVLPLSVIVLVFTFVIINGVYFGGNNQIAEVVQPIPIESKITPTNDSQTALSEVAKVPVEPAPNLNFANSSQPKFQVKKREIIPVDETNFVAVKSRKKLQIELPKVKVDDVEGGSRTMGLDVKPKIIYPRNIFPDELIEVAPNNENKNDIITKQILLPRGIEIVSENGNRRVKSVKANSLAAKSGVQVGDFIEAIDGEKVSGDAVRSKKLEGKQITVLRGIEKVEINLTDQ